MTQPLRIGIVGVGKISDQYFKGIKNHPTIETVGCCDLDQARAQSVAEAQGIRAYETTNALFADETVDLVVNLTIPAAHTTINCAALQAGKHVYVEKPLAVDFEDGQKAVVTAEKTGRLLGCAPDTFLGSAQQTARAAVDSGLIGRPIAATAFLTCRGHETWHPAPEFYYKKGGGPMLDMGPYYLTALVNLFGPIKRIAGLGVKGFDQRTITSQPLHGKVIDVEVNTHITGVAEFHNGAVATIIMTFDTGYTGLKGLQLYGTDGTLHAGDPNKFDDDIRFWKIGAKEPEILPVQHATGMGRGSGPADMASALAQGVESRINSPLALHVLEAMLAFEQSGESGAFVELTTTTPQPAPIPAGLPFGQLHH